MIPILYEKNEKDFSTLGLGALMHSINPTVTEERNGLFYFEMDYPINNTIYEELKIGRIIVADACKDLRKQQFIITRITRPIDGIFSIYAEHISQYKTQNTNILSEIKFNGDANKALQKWNESLIDGGVFTTFSDITHFQKDVNWNIQTIQNARQVLGGVKNSILDIYGGEYKFNNLHIGLYQHRGEDRGITVNYAYNLTDYVDDEDITNTFTSIYPFATLSTNINEEPKIITLPEKFIQGDNVELYRYPKIKTVDLSGEDVKDIITLRKKGKLFLKKNLKSMPKFSIKLSYIDLYQTINYKENKNLELDVRLCDTITINLTKYGIKNLKMKIVSLKWDVLSERVIVAQVGNLSNRFSSNVVSEINSEILDMINKIKVDMSAESIRSIAIKEATNLIKSGVGGYIRYQSDRILIMDTDDEDTAQNVWQFNKNGIGHSKNGVNGNYIYAWTIHGGFNTNFITTNSITVDKLASDVGQNLNIEANEVIIRTRNDFERNADDIKNQINDTIEKLNKVSSENIDFTTESINELQEKYGIFVQDYDDYKGDVTKKIAKLVKDLNEQIDEAKENFAKVFMFSERGLEISSPNSNVVLVMGNDEIAFFDGDKKVAYLSGQRLVIASGIFVDNIIIGNHMITKDDLKGTIIDFVGGN